MSSDYKILYSSKDQFYVMALERIMDWYSQLENVEKRLNEISNMNSFQGVTADSVKSYINEVHNIILISVRQTLLDFQYRVSLYVNGYYDIESNIYATINSSTIRNLKNRDIIEQEYLRNKNIEINSTIGEISDIAHLYVPSQSNVLDSLIDTVDQIDELDRNISDYEKSKKEEANSDLASLINSLYNVINTYYLMRGTIVGYKSGDYSARTEVIDIYNKVTSSMEYTNNNQEAVINASENIQSVFMQQQKDYEDACEARKDEGTANMIMGFMAVAGGTMAIVLTAGAATPIVVVAAVSGTCATAYGVSNIIEGGQDLYYGSKGNLTDEAWNPIRDTVFCGNQSLYDAWGGLSMTVAGLCIPVNSAVNSVAGLSGKVIAKEVGKKIVEESVKDFVIGETSQYITKIAANKFDLNKTQSLILNQVIENGMEKGVDFASKNYVKYRDGAVDSNFTDRMSYEDAKRYNSFINDPDSYRLNRESINADINDINNSFNNDYIKSNKSPIDIESEKIKIDDGDYVDYSRTSNTKEELDLIREMEENDEFLVEYTRKNKSYVEDYGPIKADPNKAPPAEVKRRLPGYDNGVIIGDRDSGTFEYIPKNSETQEIMKKYGQTSIKCENDKPIFSPFTNQKTPWGNFKCEVEIGHMVGTRKNTSGVVGNYEQADIELSKIISEKTGKEVQPEEIMLYRKQNELTWHEDIDGKTMQLIPTKINAAFAHNGGVSVKKYEQGWGDVSLVFDDQ